jgi:hypothetical protein
MFIRHRFRNSNYAKVVWNARHDTKIFAGLPDRKRTVHRAAQISGKRGLLEDVVG